VAEDENEPQRPHALLSLASEAEGDEKTRLLDELREKYAFHAATELARAKGLLQ
jgi:hypothetical protein